MLIIKGKKLNIVILAKEHSLLSKTLRGRLKAGWSLEKALNTPVAKAKTITYDGETPAPSFTKRKIEGVA
jgi:hypothetical protein